MKKLFNFSIVLIVVLSICTFSVFAQTGFEGMTCYRDGVLAGYEWHAGVVISPKVTTTGSPIVHILSGSTVGTCTRSIFIGTTNIFKGVYKPNGVTTGDLDYAKSMANDLAGEGISYTYVAMISHTASGDWIFPENITRLRCDGVTEYCYEYYGTELQGTDDNYGNYHWDISSTEDAPYHSANYLMSPKNQASLMQLVDSDGL